MSSYFMGQMGSGLVTACMLTSFLWFAAWRWPPSYGKAMYVGIVAFALGVMLRAINAADDGPPQLLDSFAQLLIPQLIVLIPYVWLAWRHYRKNLPYPELAASPF